MDVHWAGIVFNNNDINGLSDAEFNKYQFLNRRKWQFMSICYWKAYASLS